MHDVCFVHDDRVHRCKASIVSNDAAILAAGWNAVFVVLGGNGRSAAAL